MATKAQKLGNVILITFLINLLLNGTAVFGSLTCAYKFVPASDSDTADCINDCTDMNFWAIEVVQFVPSMTHLNWENTCYCSIQSPDIWSKGKVAIASYTVSEDSGVEIPPDEGQEYTYDSCVDVCIGFEYQTQVKFDDKTSDADLWFHVVAKGNCYCKAKPVFAEEPSEAPDDLLSFLPNANDGHVGDLEYHDDAEYYDDDDGDEWYDPSFDDIPVDFIEGSEDDPAVQEELKRNKRSRSSGKNIPAIPEDDPDDHQYSKRNKMSPSAMSP